MKFSPFFSIPLTNLFSSHTTVLGIPTLRRIDTDDPLKPRCEWKDDPFDDLKNDRIHAIVFYGRMKYVDILNAYLEKNLKKNGGVLDKVFFATVKYDEKDMNYLRQLVRRNRDSYIVPHIKGGDWDNIW